MVVSERTLWELTLGVALAVAAVLGGWGLAEWLSPDPGPELPRTEELLIEDVPPVQRELVPGLDAAATDAAAALEAAETPPPAPTETRLPSDRLREFLAAEPAVRRQLAGWRVTDPAGLLLELEALRAQHVIDTTAAARSDRLPGAMLDELARLRREYKRQARDLAPHYGEPIPGFRPQQRKE